MGDEKFRSHRTFPATELMPYAEPVAPEDMQKGRVYFALQFLDRDLFVPVLEPLIFLGLDLDGESRNERYFQDFDSYRSGVRYGKANDKNSGCFQAYRPGEGKHIFEYDHALNLLMSCALSRRDEPDIDRRIRRSADVRDDHRG